MKSWTISGLASQAVAMAAATSSYTLKDNFTGANFFDNFYFMDQIDPSKGFVEYVNQTTAMDLGLYNYRNNKNWLYVDNTTIASSPGRKSVRIQSNNVYNQCLFVFDVSHIP
jgi:hypothetical protein